VIPETALTSVDEQHLRQAIELAQQARLAGDAPFGSVLVGSDGRVLREARNTVASDRDISAHPELKIAVWAARELAADVLRKATMYTSCQPCIMCTGAIDRSGIGRVVFALSDEDLRELGSAGFPRVPQYGPALLELARTPLAGYYQSLRASVTGEDTGTIV
jgi:tRNA(Arg) A34 adenosine deaminase TadA